MTATPSLLTAPELPPAGAAPSGEAAAAAAGPALADLLYDGFYLVFLLKNGKTPRSADGFRRRVGEFLAEFERQGKREGFEAEDLFDAKYAFCATVDEAILASAFTIREEWERAPLQLALFGDQLAGEAFFDRLENVRNGGRRRMQVLEVFHMCLLLGFKGKYLLEGPEKLSYLTSQVGEQLAHLRGRRRPFAPHWAPPDKVAHVLGRVLSSWVLAAVLALCGLLAYTGLQWQLGGETRRLLAGYDNIVALPAKPPTLLIKLP